LAPESYLGFIYIALKIIYKDQRNVFLLLSAYGKKNKKKEKKKEKKTMQQLLGCVQYNSDEDPFP
jgi:hypothetical protein